MRSVIFVNVSQRGRYGGRVGRGRMKTCEEGMVGFFLCASFTGVKPIPAVEYRLGEEAKAASWSCRAQKQSVGGSGGIRSSRLQVLPRPVGGRGYS